MRWRTKTTDLPLGRCILVGGLVLASGVVGCKRPSSGAPDEVVADDLPGAGEAEAPVVRETEFLGPLTAAPWLGHADDGALVKVEFFAGDDPAETICRSHVKTSNGNTRTVKTPFTASSDLGEITWGEGQSHASYSAETESLEATVDSDAGLHRVTLQQVTPELIPELVTYRRSIPSDKQSEEAYQKFADGLEAGADWWESGGGWEVLVTPEAIQPAPIHTALIRPVGQGRLEIAELEPGGDFNIPIECQLPPGSSLGEDEATVGVVAELHHADSVAAAWILNLLNPGAIAQQLNALWVHQKTEPVPSGKATLYIYLARTRSEGDTKTAEIAKPISNLLKLEIQLPPPGAPATADPEARVD